MTSKPKPGLIVDELRKNFASGVTLDFEFRKQQLKAIYNLIEENRSDICDALYKDLHKNETEAWFSEIDVVVFEIGSLLENMDNWLKPEVPDTSTQPAFMNSKFEIVKAPQGVVTMISPWNYPVRLVLAPLAGAIAAGNVVVIKQSQISAHTSALLTNLLSKYMDNRVVKLVNGAIEETTVLLKQQVDHMFFTGSGMVGKIVAQAAASQLCRLTLELGGKCPVIITNLAESKAKLDIIARRLVWGKLLNCGQTCLASDYVLVDKDIHNDLILSIKKAILEFYSSNPKNSADYGRIISSSHFERIKSLVEKSNADMVIGNLEEWDINDLYIPPTVMDNAKPDDSLMSDELFAPVLPIMQISSSQDAIEFINSRNLPLAIYLFTDDSNVRSAITSRTRSGSIVYEDTMIHAGCNNIPFGGFGHSGAGSYMGKYSILNFSHQRNVMTNSLNFPPKKLDALRLPPYTGNDYAWKKFTSQAMVFPNFRFARSGIFSYCLTFIPSWRTLQAIPHIIRAMIRKD
ncbi:Fatty aldehyde dehydrogenase [Smittium culicis]|uniref:Aldehyde dehydrogenase n=2 Tax=Smittium culicis TaxID=133412 RepID=A0A1R1Y0C1_9FUNG|nr:Fatty aldehyde dehydrogenase [Smittium culicis]